MTPSGDPQPDAESWEDLDDRPAWRFAVSLYGMPDAGPNFIVLQDRCALDVTFLIFVLYLRQARGLTADRPLLQALREVVAEWRMRVVVPLRGVRRELKGMQERGYQPLVENLRQTIKAAELRAEQLELEMLDRWMTRNAASFPLGAPEVAKSIENLIADVIAIQPQTNVEPEPVRTAVAAIALAYSASTFRGAVDSRR